MLQREGIGPRETLENAGVKIRVANEHVGRHLTNHPVVLSILFSTPGSNFKSPEETINSYFTPGAWLPNPNTEDQNCRIIQWITLPNRRFTKSTE